MKRFLRFIHRGQPPGLRAVLVASLVVFAPLAASAIELPAGFTAETLATQLNGATAFVRLPDGRIFIADQTGPLRVWKDGALQPKPVLDLSDRLDTWWERGLIGVTLDPDFPRTPHVFVLYVAKAPYTHHVLSRFTFDGAILDPASEQILLEGDDQSRVTSKQPAGHQGGPLRFGPDGKLYVAIGEQAAGLPAQQLDRLLGKILRLNPDGTIPTDNPFHAQTTGKYRAIWALGLRNPFGLAFQPETGRLFATDVGLSAFEEVNEIVRGANYGWPEAEGMSTHPVFKNPLHAYPPAIGRSIVGGAFYPRDPAARGVTQAFPSRWRGKFFFADWKANWIKVLDPEAPESVVTFARGLDGPVALEVEPDGAMLVLNRATIWRDGKNWKSDAGSLVRIRYTGDARPVAGPVPQPSTLTEIGVLVRLAPFTPQPDFVEVKLNAAPWFPGVSTRRWISLPVAAHLAVDADGEFGFPAGTVVIQHHVATKTGAPLETQILRFNGPGSHSRVARAGAYRWSNGSATLVTETAIVPVPGDETRRWMFSAPEQELKIETVVAGFLLPLSLRQLDAAQTQLWITRGWLPPDAGLAARPRLVPLDHTAASAEVRVRSYLDANCATCHRPGGLSRAAFDTRFETPLEKSGLLLAEPIGGDLGIPGAKVLIPGVPERSLLFRRLADAGPFRMPPLGLHDETSPVAPLVEAWIRSLKPAP